MDSSENIEQQIISICQKRVPNMKLGPETSLIRDLGLDSLQALETISDIETGLGVSIPSDVLPEIDTIADVARLVIELKNTSSAT